ncbi:hypothetical protein [Dawidia soli]|uniref:PIN domain-containing protein n=1 Tax=Dawidia soli TaxID=2782352 RepID=A0AAP2DCR5_9BACT|nr:hypothetical protein [Dawidia soli]MBT1689761.1 hypothetical protein [Dawidia soli]
MPKYTAVIDNTVLVNLTYLKDFQVFRHLKALFHGIYVPMEVRLEYEKMSIVEPDRLWILDRLQPGSGFYSLCTQYDAIVLTILQTISGIDAGEAEAVAQQHRIGARYILSDDRAFRKALAPIFPHSTIIGTLHVVALLDLNQLLTDRNEALKRLYFKHRFTAVALRQAYTDMARHLGLQLTRKDLSNRTSIKRLGFQGKKRLSPNV